MAENAPAILKATGWRGRMLWGLTDHVPKQKDLLSRSLDVALALRSIVQIVKDVWSGGKPKTK